MNRSIARAAQILSYFAESSHPSGISEVSRALGIPKASASDCLHTLAQTGLLQLADPVRKTFTLGPEGARLGYAAMREYGVVRLAHEELDALCRAFGQSAFLAVRSGDRIVIADKAEPLSPAHLKIRTGEALELHLTAAGKAMLAAMTNEQVAELIGPSCYSTHTFTSIGSYPYLIRELTAIREKGYACENFENSTSVYSLAAPVYDCCDRVCAALSLSIPKSALPSCPTGAMAQALMDSAVRLSARLDSTVSATYPFIQTRSTVSHLLQQGAISMNKDLSLNPSHFITDPAVLHDPNGKYADESRRFQGIPGIECTPKGRFFTVFYTGEDGEKEGNFLLLHKSDDGVNFGKAFMAVEAPCDEVRCYDPCLWISPDGRLHLYFAQSFGYYDGRCGVWESVCEDPDADEIVFTVPRRIANGIMMNKPTIRQDGAWLLPCAIWAVSHSELNWLPKERLSNVYISTDNGQSYHLLGGADYPNRYFDEHHILPKADGTLEMYIRGKSDIGRSVSTDGGKTWTVGEDTGLGNPNSRFCLRRLRSGRLLLVNHVNFGGLEHLYKERSNLTAFLSDDDGETWQGGLLLDERASVSYPDLAQAPDGTLNIIYDYNRYSDKEILLARFTEEDVLAGRLVSEGSTLRVLVNKAFGEPVDAE